MVTNRSEIDIIKDKLDIVDVIGKTVNLKHISGDIYKGATGSSKSGHSLNVDRGMQAFNNWANESGGDVFNWIAYDKNLNIDTDFPVILKIAADMAGITLTNTNFKFDYEANNIFTITTAIVEHYHNCLTDEHRAHITTTWGITDETIDRLHIGFAPAEEDLIEVFDGLFHKDDLLKTGFMIKTRDGIKSFYQGRIVFPYWKGGKVVYSIARQTKWTPDNEYEEGRKYKKQLTRKDKRTYVSEVISNSHFYGEDTIRKKDYCVITEGVTDCIIAIQAGEPCISPVTVRFKNNELDKAVSLTKNMKNVIICNDNDEAGKAGAIDTADHFDKNGITVRLINLPKPDDLDKMDLAEYLRDHDQNELKNLIKNSIPLSVVKLNNIPVSNEPLDNIPAATEFIKNNLNGQGISYKTAFIETHIKKHFGFSSKVTTDLISETKASIKEQARQGKQQLDIIPTEQEGLIPENIIEAAREIIYTGDTVKKIIGTHATMHVGDEPLALALLVSIGIQSVLNSDGIHPKVSGTSGKGKSHCCKTMIHLVPNKYKFNTTLSDKVIYYMGIPDGAVIFSDDIELSETLEGIIKRSTSNFQEGDNYTTLDKNLNVNELCVPPRIAWWLTSVDDDQSIQLLNRQFGGTIDESKKQDNNVYLSQVDGAITGELVLPENEDIEICRCIIEDIKQQLFTVVIPYARGFEWTDKTNRRNFPIFIDIIKALAVLRHRQRYKTEENVLIANIDDYNDAKDLYIGRAKNQGTKLTDVELKLCLALNGAGDVDYKYLQKALGVSQGRISQIINGKTRGDSGLINKVPGFFAEQQNVKITEDTSVRKMVCSLDDFDPFSNFGTVITLKQEAIDMFNEYYPAITPVLPGKNDNPLTGITYITKYILYTQEKNSNIGSDNKINNLCEKSENQGNKVITPLPLPKTEGNNGVMTGGVLPEAQVITSKLPETAQKQLIKDLIMFKKANYAMTDNIDDDMFVFDFCKLHDKVWKPVASKVKLEVERLNGIGWRLE